jgi:hypothetical protein
MRLSEQEMLYRLKKRESQVLYLLSLHSLEHQYTLTFTTANNTDNPNAFNKL